MTVVLQLWVYILGGSIDELTSTATGGLIAALPTIAIALVALSIVYHIGLWVGVFRRYRERIYQMRVGSYFFNRRSFSETGASSYIGYQAAAMLASTAVVVVGLLLFVVVAFALVMFLLQFISSYQNRYEVAAKPPSPVPGGRRRTQPTSPRPHTRSFRSPAQGPTRGPYLAGALLAAAAAAVRRLAALAAAAAARGGPGALPSVCARDAAAAAVGDHREAHLVRQVHEPARLPERRLVWDPHLCLVARGGLPLPAHLQPLRVARACGA